MSKSSSFDKGETGDSSAEKILTATTILDFCGEDHLEDAQELIVRDGGFTSLDPLACPQLSQLRTISLSHNKFSSLEGFSSFLILKELNMNFNSLSSIRGLQCKNLEALFLSHNQLTNAALRDLPSTLPMLRVLCLYMNKIQNLEAALTDMRRLPKLKDLSLAGNPCAFGSEYKHKTVQTLPRLQVLDGETLQRIDHDLARMFFQRKEARSGDKTSNQLRPSTAPASKSPRAKGPRSMFDSVARGNVKLFRSQFLNTNPILLEYLAKSTLSNSNQTARSHMKTLQENAESTETAVPAVSTGSQSADPYATIRKLLRTIDDLRTENEELREKYDKTHQSTMDDLAAENRRLTMECANMYAVQEDNKLLRARVQELEKKGKKKRRDPELENRYAKLEREHAVVVQERNELRDRIHASELEEELARPRTAAQLLTECEDELDSDLAELLQRNEDGLKEIRATLRSTKREMEHADKKMVRQELRSQMGKKSRKLKKSSTMPERPVLSMAGNLDRYLLGQRPTTPNLLGRPIETAEDMLLAQAALKQAKARMKALEKERRQRNREVEELGPRSRGPDILQIHR